MHPFVLTQYDVNKSLSVVLKFKISNKLLFNLFTVVLFNFCIIKTNYKSKSHYFMFKIIFSL